MKRTGIPLLFMLVACTGPKGPPGPEGAIGPQGSIGPAGPLPAVALGEGLSGDGSAGAPLRVVFGGSGSATEAARADHKHDPAPLLIVGGTSAGKGTGLFNGSATFPFRFPSPPAVIITPGEPDDAGVTRCRIVTWGSNQVGWHCWTYATEAAAETIHWIAFQQGSFTVPTKGGASRKIMAGVFNSKGANCSSCIINFPGSFSGSPLVFASVDESDDQAGATSAKVVSVNVTAATIATTHGGAAAMADRIHWVAVEPTGSDPIMIGATLLYANLASVTVDAGRINYSDPLAHVPAAVVLTVEGGVATSVRNTTPYPHRTGVNYSHYTDTGSGTTAPTRVNWMAWIDG